MVGEDRQSLIRTAEIRRPVLEFGDGVQGGEVWDMKTFVEDGVAKQKMLIKMTEELRARFGYLMRPEDLREGFVLWIEVEDLLISITSNPSNPRIFALRSFDHQPTKFSLTRNILINTLQRLMKENAEQRKGIHAEQEKFRRWIEGSGRLELKSIIDESLNEKLNPLIMLLSKKG